MSALAVLNQPITSTRMPTPFAGTAVVDVLMEMVPFEFGRRMAMFDTETPLRKLRMLAVGTVAPA